MYSKEEIEEAIIEEKIILSNVLYDPDDIGPRRIKTQMIIANEQMGLLFLYSATPLFYGRYYLGDDGVVSKPIERVAKIFGESVKTVESRLRILQSIHAAHCWGQHAQTGRTD
jgi:hypothetical protein